MEPARADDWASISEIIHKFARSEALEQWWHSHPDSFFVVRDEHGGVQGFYQAIVASRVHKNVPGRDPLAASWAKDLPHLEDRAATLWLRRTLDRDTGEEPSLVGAAAVEAASTSPLLDEQAHELVVNGSRIGLTPLEFGVFAYLVARPNKAVARYELVEAVWGYGKEASTSNAVGSFHGYLRAPEPRLLEDCDQRGCAGLRSQ